MSKLLMEIRVGKQDDSRLYGMKRCEYDTTVDILEHTLKALTDLNSLHFANVSGFIEDFGRLAESDPTYINSPYAAINLEKVLTRGSDTKIVMLCWYTDSEIDNFTACLDDIWLTSSGELPIPDGIADLEDVDLKAWVDQHGEYIETAVEINDVYCTTEAEIINIIEVVSSGKSCWTYGYSASAISDPDIVEYYVPIVKTCRRGC